jgi:DNA-binding MarR family transcriptional regulator
MFDKTRMDTYLVVMLGLHRKHTLRYIAEEIGRSLHWVSLLCEDLEEVGYVENPYLRKTKLRRARARKITAKGLELMRKNNLLKENYD